MRRLKRAIITLMLLCQCSVAWASEPLIYSANAIYTAAQIGANQRFYQRALANRSYVFKNLRHLKGDIGESVMHTLLTDRTLGGSWVQTNPKFAQPGRQGFDGLYVKYEKGHPTQLFVGEAKYGSSQLKETKDGLQMSGTWVRKRLTTQVNGLGKAANAVRRGDVTFSSSGKSENTMQLRAFDADGKSCKISVWWEKKGGRSVLNVDTNGRNISKENVYSALKEVQELYKNNLAALGRGDILYRGRVFKNIKFVGNDVTLDVVDVTSDRKTSHVDTRKLSDKQRKHILADVRRAAHDAIADSLGISRQNAREIVKTLSKKLTVAELLATKGSKALRQEIIKAQVENGVNRQEAERYADKLLKPTAESQRTVHRDFALRTTFNAFRIGLTGLLEDAATQFWHTGQVDWWRTAKTAVFTFGSSLAGQYAGFYALNSRIGQSIINRVSNVLHVGAGTLAEVGGGIIASAIGAYGAYFFGQIDLATANRLVATSAIAMIGSKAVVAGVTGLVATFGTAGTGTAIATLHGAVAVKATLAAIGTLGHSAIGTSIVAALGGIGITATLMGVGILAVVGYGTYELIEWVFSPSEEELTAKQMAQKRELLQGHLNIAKYSL